jgi:hypothetical protein
MELFGTVAAMLQFLTGELIVLVIRAPPPCHYSFMPKESIVTTSNIVGGSGS